MQYPFSRTHEREADALGLQLVTRACRNPRQAIRAHEKLLEYEGKGTTAGESGGSAATIARLAATHPPTEERLATLRTLLPDSEKEYKELGCAYRKEQLYRALVGAN